MLGGHLNRECCHGVLPCTPSSWGSCSKLTGMPVTATPHACSWSSRCGRGHGLAPPWPCTCNRRMRRPLMRSRKQRMWHSQVGGAGRGLDKGEHPRGTGDVHRLGLQAATSQAAARSPLPQPSPTHGPNLASPADELRVRSWVSQATLHRKLGDSQAAVRLLRKAARAEPKVRCPQLGVAVE